MNSYHLDFGYTKTHRGIWKIQYCVAQVYTNDLGQTTNQKETDCLEKSFTLKYKADGLAVARPFHLELSSFDYSSMIANPIRTLKYNLDNVGTKPLSSTDISLVVKRVYGTQGVCFNQTQNHTFAIPLSPDQISEYSIPVNYTECPAREPLQVTLCTSYQDLSGSNKQACTSFQDYFAP